MSSGGALYATGQGGSGLALESQARDSASAGFGFHSQKAGDAIPSLRNGVEAYDRTIIQPTTNVKESAFSGEVTFDFTSSNNRWLVPSQCLLRCRLTVGQTAAVASSEAGLSAALNADVLAPVPSTVAAIPENATANHFKFTTCPASALFRSMRLVCSGVTVESQDHVHLASLLQIATEATPAMNASVLASRGQNYGEIGYRADFGAADSALSDLMSNGLSIDPKKLLCEASFKNAVNGEDAANKGIEIAIPVPLNFFSQSEWWPAARWQLICEVDPNYHENVVFNYGAISGAAYNADNEITSIAGLNHGLARPQVSVRDISLDLATVKPIIPKAISSMQVHVPTQQIQAIPVSGDGQFTIACPASTYACLVVFQSGEAATASWVDSTNFSAGQNIRNIRFTRGSTTWPKLDYNMKLPVGAGDTTLFFSADSANTNAAGGKIRARRGRRLPSERQGMRERVNATLNGSRAYEDFVDICSKRYESSGMLMTYDEWAQNPIFAARLLSPPQEVSTSLRISLDFHGAGATNDPNLIMYVCPLFSKVVTAAWSASSEYPAVKVAHQL